MMNVVIRADASLKIGTGHVMRCLTLALELKKQGASVEFICRAHEGNLIEYIQQKGFIAHSLAIDNLPQKANPSLPHADWLGGTQNEDAELCSVILERLCANWVVVDHYAIDFTWGKKIKKIVKKIMVIDDLADRKHECEVLLDQNLYDDEDVRYTDKVPGSCKLLLGPSYALLRDEFIQEKKSVLARSGIIKRILVFFGGVDVENHTISVLETLISIKHKKNNFEVDVVVGVNHPYTEDIKFLCESHNFICHVQTKEMAKLLVAADLGIGAGGITTYERLYLRLPSLLLPLSFNQIEPLMHMSEKGIVDLFSTQDDLKIKLIQKLSCENSSPPDCVENGKVKIVKFMMDGFTCLSEPKPFDVRNTYKWIQSKALRDDFLLSPAPSLKVHFEYWRKLFNDSGQRVYSILHSGIHIGNCGLKNIKVMSGESELWIYIGDLSSRGNGIGKNSVLRLLEIAKKDLCGKVVVLHVSKKNITAIELYKKVGFYEVNNALVGGWSGQEAKIMHMERII